MRVAVLSGSRADYGLLRPTIRALDEDPRFDLILLVTAMHLQEEHGFTVKEIEDDGFAIAARVPAGGPTDHPAAFSRHLGEATVAFSAALSSCKPDVLLLLGDRFEVLAAALAATGHSIGIAHVHGGELTEGSLDDATRHCVTKLAHLHFVAARPYAERVCQLGEPPNRIHIVGAAGIESIRSRSLLDRDALAATLSLGELRSPLVVLALHPASLSPERAGADADEVVAGIDEVLGGGGTVIVTLPNDDPGNGAVRERLLRWVDRTDGARAFPSLGQLRYLSLLRHADVLIGNSSSALLEAPAFELPAVNVGDRQQGRIQPENVLGALAAREMVAAALRRALRPEFRLSLAGMENPYGDGEVSRRILSVLAAAPPAEALRRKTFYDLPDAPWRSALVFGG